ncbi:hypothetical protein [Modestobacter sp. SYSU DS0511]
MAADVDPAWVAEQVAHEPIEAPLGARFLSALADRTGVRAWTTPDGAALLVRGPLEPSRLVPDGEPLWAQVAPADTASLRSFLTAGWCPVGAEVLFGS